MYQPRPFGTLPVKMVKPVYILNGPNLNLLGVREPEIYGDQTLSDIETACAELGRTLGVAIDFRQTNHEGVLIDWVQEARTAASALILNPAGYGHTSVALHDALKALDVPLIEVHLSQPAAREAFRAHSYVTPLAAGAISGFGALGYMLGLRAAAELIQA